MFRHIIALLLGFFVIMNALSEAQVAHENTIRVGLLHGDPEPFKLPIAVLEKACEKLNPPAKLELVDISDMNQKRALKSLASGNVSFDIFFSGFSAARENDLLQIDVPLTMGLLGARVLVVNEKHEERLMQNVTSEAELKNLRIGSGVQWPDSDILLFNQYQVLRASYQGLWQMLSNNRIDAFARGIEEAFIEIEQRRNETPAPKILNTWLLVYPLDYFVYLSPKNQPLYQELNRALQQAHSSGEIAAVIAKVPSAQKALHWLRNNSHTTIHLHNPLISERVRSLSAEYWLPEIRP